MTAIAEPNSSPHTLARARPQAIGGLAFDWLMAALSTIFLGGLYLDGWAHNHGKVDQSFFTPWHAFFYAGFALTALVLLVSAAVNWRRGYTSRAALPAGYGLALLGTAIFAAAGVGDLIWHTLFGIEEDFEALVSPTHLMLGAGLALMVSAPLRAGLASAWGSRLAAVRTGAGFALPAYRRLYLLHDVLPPTHEHHRRRAPQPLQQRGGPDGRHCQPYLDRRTAARPLVCRSAPLAAAGGHADPGVGRQLPGYGGRGLGAALSRRTDRRHDRGRGDLRLAAAAGTDAAAFTPRHPRSLPAWLRPCSSAPISSRCFSPKARAGRST